MFPYRKQFLFLNIQNHSENIEVSDSIKLYGVVLDGELNLKNFVGVMSSKLICYYLSVENAAKFLDTSFFTLMYILLMLINKNQSYFGLPYNTHTSRFIEHSKFLEQDFDFFK